MGGLVLETLHTASTLTCYNVCHDGSGNVTALVNRSTHRIAAAYEYGPFGENVRTQVRSDDPLNTAGQPFRYSTKYTDNETKLVYYGYRYYDSSLGRFINRDPLGETGGVNLYAFCGNAPTNRLEILGMFEWDPSIGESIRERATPDDEGGWVLQWRDNYIHKFADGSATWSNGKGESGIVAPTMTVVGQREPPEGPDLSTPTDAESRFDEQRPEPNSGFDAGSQRGDVIAAGGITERSQARAENFKKYRNMYVNDLGSYLKAKEALIKANLQLAGYFDRLETNRMPVILNVNKGSVSQFRPDSMIINWDPTYVSVTGDKERAPGVIGLIHEMGHFMNFVTDPTGYTARVRAGDDPFDNREERFVTTGVEWATADAMGYGRRSSHTPIATYHSDSMFSTQFSY